MSGLILYNSDCSREGGGRLALPGKIIYEGIDAMKEVPIWEKTNLTIEGAASYSNIGLGKLREITNSSNCKFVLWVGNKRLIKRKLFEN